MSDKISIIVPVYNAEKYIEHCVNSILNQTYKNIEVVLIDDGSTDNSGDICDQYATNNRNIISIHQKNGGSTNARKNGILHASGEFCLFVDSDDWIEKDTCEITMSCILESKADVVCFAYIREDIRKTVVSNGIKNGIYKKKNLEYICRNLFYCENTNTRGTTRALWTLLIRKKIMLKTFFDMDDGAQYGEDTAWSFAAILNAEGIYFTDKPLYHYRIREGSVMRRLNLNYYEQINAVYTFLYNLFNKNEYKDILVQSLNQYMDELVIHGLNYCFNASKKIKIPSYLFVGKRIKRDSKIIIYGAGMIGESYYKYFLAEKKFQIVSWIDQNWEKITNERTLIESPKRLLSEEYDFVIIAVKQKELAENIQKELMELYHIAKEKIYWEPPMHILDFYDDARL